jgi:trigger factor
MERQIENIAGGKLQIIFVLTPQESAKFEARALKELGSTLTITGFRPGKAPVDLIKARVGAEALQSEILYQASREFYPQVVKDSKLDVIGQPEISLITATPLSFKITAAKLPEVNIGKWEKIKVKRNKITVDQGEAEKVINDLLESRAKEVAVTRAAAKGDLAEIDFEVAVDRIVIDGGKGKKYPVVLGKGQLIPGFEDNLIGLKAGEEKQFELTFPPDYRKDLAGKKAQINAKLLQVFERTLPELNDEFAVALGRFTSLEDLRTKLNQNLLDDHMHHEEQRVEQEMFDALLKVANFSEIPEILITSELDKMLHEFSHSIEERGLEWTQYLQTIHKKEEDLHQEFRPQAEKRVKSALLIRAFAKDNKLEVDDSTIEKEITHALEHYGSDERAVAQLNSDEYKDYLRSILINKRVVDWLKEKLVE